MKLAEALIERAEIQKKNTQLLNRIKRNTRVQEGDLPSEKPEELITEYENNMKRFLVLVRQINLTNSGTFFDESMTIADAIALRDNLGSKIKIYREICESAVTRFDRYNRHEIKFVRCIDVGDLQVKINRYSKEFRELDTKLQGINWTVDLIE